MYSMHDHLSTQRPKKER